MLKIEIDREKLNKAREARRKRARGMSVSVIPPANNRIAQLRDEITALNSMGKKK